MFCRKCGAKLPENAKVCPACGAEETGKAKGILILAIVGVLILLLVVAVVVAVLTGSLLAGKPQPTQGATLPIQTTTEAATTEATAPVTTEAATVPETTEVTVVPTTAATEPKNDGTYLERVKDPNCEIFREPNYDAFFVRAVGAPGTFTIVEERWDYEGNLWGRLKSGLGWINLSENRSAVKQALPITIGLAGEQRSAKGNCIDIQVDWDYSIKVLFYPMETITDVKLYRHNFMYDAPQEAPVFETEVLTSENPLVAEISFPGDLSSYLIEFTDASGNRRSFEVYTSGRNGSLGFSER